MARLKDDRGPVVVIGTGLTMIDMVLSLRAAEYGGQIIGASRSGLLPLAHEAPQPSYDSAAAQLCHKPQRLSTLLKTLRREARSHHWQAVFDQWRPHLVPLWDNMPITDRQKFLTRHFTRWNIHRHRMAPQIAAVMAAEQTAGRVILKSGHVQALPTHTGVTVSIGGDTVEASYAFDCRGPGYDVRRATAPLLRQMLEAQIISPDPTGWGIRLDTDLNVSGQAGLYAIGPLAIGARLETTAVPELRGQAALVAARLLAAV